LKVRAIRSPLWCAVLALLMPVWPLLPNRVWFALSSRALEWDEPT
jgi:hypothetical protein